MRGPRYSQYDQVWIGILIGCIVPILAYGLTLYFYDLMDQFEIFQAANSNSIFRERTIALIAIIANVIPMQLLNRRDLPNAMRGIVFPTFVYIVIWMFFYGFELLGINV
jgi:amino acid permease